DFVKRESHGPFFLYVAYNAPHAPLQASQEYLDRNTHIENKRRRTYAAMITAVDDGVGRILETLKEEGIDENTIVFFLSDNGGPLEKNASDNGILREGKGSPFEGGIRVPFAVRWPGKVPAGVDYEEPVISLDILATIVAEANVDTSANKPLDGTNLMPHLRGERSGPPHDILFWRGFDQKWFAARRANNKLVNKPAGKMLFDLETDISEADNLISTDAKTHQDLEKRVEAWNSEMIDPVFDKLGSWKLDNSKTAKKNKKGEET
ncbi:MAG: sulfatase-like hydrolase/transferase, partial [Gammaproteobacteria bacterium]|nr:sulfatase-like hydrolase/transferase [Gammaproteobacteria bacterium]